MKQDNELGIYIHIPFCKRKCYYCDFVSFENANSWIDEYIKKVKEEILQYNLELYNITTIYIGGGTPSYIDSKYIVEILKTLKEKLRENKTKFEDIEITIEINPGTVTEEKLEKYKSSGINRISIGLQTTNNELLRKIGRIHSFEEFLESYKLIKKKHFENINIDLMIGLPNQKIEDLKKSVEEIKKLNPTHVSIYSLILEENTKFMDLLNCNKLKLPEEEAERQMYWYVKNKLELYGYNHYEISNFAKKGKESKHNMNCWEQKQYIGIGVAAHSYSDKKRYANKENIKEYISNNKKEMLEEQNKEDEQKEYMLLGLRKIDGVKISKFKEKFIESPIFLYKKELDKLEKQQLIEVDGDVIKLTNKGLDLANQVWEEFV